jgi:hypothetical protein
MMVDDLHPCPQRVVVVQFSFLISSLKNQNQHCLKEKDL